MTANIVSIVKLQEYIFQKVYDSGLTKKLKLYNQIPKNSPMPYAYLGNFTSEFSAAIGLKIICMQQKIFIYSRGDNQEIMHFAERLSKEIECQGVAYEDINIKHIIFDSMSFDVMRDGKTFETILNFKIKLEVIKNVRNEITNIA